MRETTRLTLHPGAVAAVVAVCAAVGVVLGFAADVLFTWFESTFDGAPALLRAAAALPDVVTIVGLGVAGLIVGVWVVGEWESETLVCEVQPDGVKTRLHQHTAWVDRCAITAVYLDHDELVLAEAGGRMLAVGKVDGVGRARLARTFTSAGYPWSDGGHPLEGSFATFVEGRDDLGEVATDLVKQRAIALEDGNKARARALRRELSDAGVLVRDRRGEQQYALLGESEPPRREPPST